MGLNQGGGSSKTYLKITDGKIAKKVSEGDAGAIKCTNKDGTRVWYENHFGSISGYITNIYKRDGQYGSDLCIEISDDENYELQIGWTSKYSTGFLLAMPNIDFNEKVVFNPWMKVVNDQKRTALYINKEGSKESYKWFWTKEEPKDCPPMVQIKVKGELVWDDSDKMEYLEKYLNENIVPKLNKKIAVTTVVEEIEGDLPF